MPKPKKLPSKYQPWVDARKQFRLSDAQIQMARELGLNPRKFGKMANHRQERWKMPLGDYIQFLYQKRFGKPQPQNVRSIERLAKEQKAKRAARKQRKLAAKEQAGDAGAPGSSSPEADTNDEATNTAASPEELRPADDDLLPEYDFRTMRGMVRGKYAAQYQEHPMTNPEVDQRSPDHRARDEQIAAEPQMAPLDLPRDAPFSPVEAHLGPHSRRPLAVTGVVENGLVRPLDPAVKLPEHSRVIIVTTEGT
jgi:hypothetical protein